MTKKNAIIHIGGHKTGSSAIQSFCMLNATRLQQLGIIYPVELVAFQDRVGGQAHHCLVNLLMDATSFWKSYNLRPKSMSDSDIVAFLKSLPRDKNILLSSENLVWLDKNAIKTLQELLEAFDVHVVLYARRQDNALQALYQTVVASIGEAKSFKDYTSGDVRKVFEYDTIAEDWQSVVGEGKVVSRAYEPGQLYQQDSVKDFFHVLEGILQTKIDTADWARDTDTVNRGLPAHITRLICYFNNNLFSKKLIIPAIKIMAKVLYKNSRGSYEIIPPSERKTLLESFAKSNESLAKNFMGRQDGVLFKDLSIKQTDQEWDAKYKTKGSHVRLLMKDIVAHCKSLLHPQA